MEYLFKQIGVIHSPIKQPGGPIQPCFSKNKGTVEVFKEYEKGLKDIEGFSHIMLVYYFHESDGYSLHVKPFLDDNEKGVFATRIHKRPNKIGISIVRLMSRSGNMLEIDGIDALDQTPLLDIKPYVPPFDNTEKVRIGWLEGKI